MKIALLDVGSNTIRLVAYQPQNGALNPFYERQETARLISYVRDGRMNPQGIEILMKAVDAMRREAAEQGCEKFCCFSTASLRGLQNQQEVLDAVKRACGVSIRALSGQEEALCDFEGLKAAAGKPDLIGCDLGGGSAQIFSSRNGALAWWASLPIGCLKMAGAYVKGVIPEAEEEARLRIAVRQALSAEPQLSGNRCDTMHLTGGSSRGALRLARELLGVQGKLLSREGLQEVISCLRKEGDTVYSLLRQFVPGREKSIVPGMMILDEISHAAGISRLAVEEYGVREGYLIRYLGGQ